MSYAQVIKDTQKAARKVARETGKPGAERTAKNPAGKGRKLDTPYLAWRDPVTGFDFKVLKSYQTNNSKEYGRWFMAVKSPMTYGSYELGDEYVSNMLLSLNRALKGGTTAIYWDKEVWATWDDLLAWLKGDKR